MRRTALTISLAVTASTLSLPLLAGTATAVSAPVEKSFVVVDTNGDGASGLYSEPTPATGVLTPVVADSADGSTDVTDIAASADGSRLVYVLDTYTDTASREKIVVRDVSTRVVRVVEDLDLNGSTLAFMPALSPDGKTVVWSRLTFSPTGFSLSTRKASVASGASTELKAGYAGAVFADAQTLLLRNEPGAWFTMPLAGGTPQAASLPAEANDATVSPDGTHVAWSLDTTTGSASTSDVRIATLAIAGGVASVGAPTTLATGQDNVHPSFTRDGTQVSFVRWDGDAGPGDVWSAPADGSAPAAASSTTTGDELSVANTWTDDGTVPAAAVTLPATLNGTSATVAWTLPADSDLSGVVVTRKLGSTTQKSVYVPAPLSSYGDTGLALGSTYTYTFQTVDRTNHYGAAATRNLTALAGVPSFADPTSTTSARASFPVTFAATAPSNATFNVDYLPSGGSWQHWVSGVGGRTRTFGAASATGVAATVSTPGKTYGFRVQAKDAYGNSTAWSATVRTVVPFDQTKATLYGGSNVYNSAAYLGSYRRLGTTKDYAKVTLVGNRLSIVGWKCSACGAFSLYDYNPADGSGTLMNIDTYSSTTKTRQVLFTRYYPGNQTHVYTLRPKATAGRPYVMLDGFAMRA